jgi:tetratricopeptide (TPR) repeat protein
MNMMYGRLLLAVALLSIPLSAAPLAEGFEAFYNLDYDTALREFQAAVARNPNDAQARNHVAQTVLYREMFRAGALESELVSGGNPFLRRDKVEPSPASVQLFDLSINKAMELTQARIDKNPNDKEALYTQGVAHGLRANYNFLVRKAWMDALQDATASRKLHNKVVELDPSFVDAKLIQGVHDYVVGSLPWHWKALGFIAGFRGDKEKGIEALKTVANKGDRNKYDAQVLLAAIYRRERRPLEALPLLAQLSARFPRNYLFLLEKTQMYGDAGNKADALATLSEVERLKRAGTPGFDRLPLEKIFYYRGNLLFWYDDLDAAADQLRLVTPKASKLDLHTAVMAWMRLGQTLDLKGKREEAKAAYRQAVSAAPQSEIAKESQRYLRSPYRRSA